MPPTQSLPARCGQQKSPPIFRRAGESFGQGRLLFDGAALELRRELFDATRGVNEALLACVGGMRVHRDVADDDLVFDAIDGLLAGRLHRGLGEETFARRDIEEADVIESGMAFGFHGGIKRVGSTLAGLVTRLDLIDDVDFALATHDLAGRVTLLGGFDGGNDFHKRNENTARPSLCQLKCPADGALS